MDIGSINLRNVDLPDFSDREILRFARAGQDDESVFDILSAGKIAVAAAMKRTVVYRELPIEIDGDVCRFASISVRSASLAKAMNKAERVVFMATTLGLEVDRLIAKYSKISPSRALIIDSVASERIEAVCDGFCTDIGELLHARGLKCGFRFSPGYGDLPIEFQKQIFELLSPEKYIGLTLNKSLMMSPSKSVSAIVALERIE